MSVYVYIHDVHLWEWMVPYADVPQHSMYTMQFVYAGQYIFF